MKIKNNLINSLEVLANPKVPLRVKSEFKDGKMVHDIHQRGWGEWLTELLSSKNRIIQLNRQVATALTDLLPDAIDHIRSEADKGEQLSSELVLRCINESDINASVSRKSSSPAINLIPADKLSQTEIPHVFFAEFNPFDIPADLAILSMDSVRKKAQKLSEEEDLNQFMGYSKIASELWIEKMQPEFEKRNKHDPDWKFVSVDIRPCELPAKHIKAIEMQIRISSDVGNTKSNAQLTEKFKNLYLELLNESRGSIVIEWPGRSDARVGLAEALTSFKPTEQRQGIDNVLIVSEAAFGKDIFVQRLKTANEAMNNQIN